MDKKAVEAKKSQKDVNPDALPGIWKMARNYNRQWCDNLDQKMIMYNLGYMYKKE